MSQALPFLRLILKIYFWVYFVIFANLTVKENLIGSSIEEDKVSSDISSGISIESASYIESNNFEEKDINLLATESENKEEEYTPKLFSEGQDLQSEETSTDSIEEDNKNSEQLFDQEIINFTDIKINDQIDQKVNGILSQFISKKNKIENRIHFKNLMNEAIRAYAG